MSGSTHSLDPLGNVIDPRAVTPAGGALGQTTDAEAAAGDGTVIALQKRVRTQLGIIIGLLGAGLPLLLVGGRLDVNIGTISGRAVVPVGKFADQMTDTSAGLPVRVLRQFTQVRSFTLPAAAGVAAANTFVCLYNSGGSDTLAVLQATVNAWSNVAAATNNDIQLIKITGSCSGGTLQAGAAIASYEPKVTFTQASVRTANPAAGALGAVVYSWAPNHVITAAGTLAATGPGVWEPVQPFFLDAGEGVVFRQTVAGDTDQRYSITIVWGERAES